MNKKNNKDLYIASCLLLAFILWTAVVSFVDVQVAGPQESTVGLASLNLFFHRLTGVHMVLYSITDWLGLVPLGFVAAFALLGLAQWIRRKQLLKVDCSILILGIFYAVVMAVFIFFEIVVINYRPVLIEGVLEASYPSSTTMLVMCVIPTAVMQLRGRIQSRSVKNCVCVLLYGFAAFMIFARLLAGVHWFTDIVGGALLSAGLVRMYRFFTGLSMK